MTLTAKTGTCVVTGMGDDRRGRQAQPIPVHDVAEDVEGQHLRRRQLARRDAELVGLYKSGLLKIDEMVTSTYSLDNINDSSQDMLDGKNIRGVIKSDESDW